MNRELLEKPFGPEQIKQREGNFGKKLDYIEGSSVIQRLNDSFEAKWSFEIVEHKILDTDEVVVLGKLAAGDIVKTQFGSSKITKARETGNMISLADDLKAAGTDALKKCATLFGVGLHLYKSSGKASSHGQSDNENKSNNNFKRGNNNGGDNGNGNNRISAKQHKYITNLSLERGISKSKLNQHCLEAYAVAVDYLTMTDASSLIENLLSQN
ncbi:RAD52 family DNA repair protein [bacterium]|nr:RAD52 family DNA repair protein [bacterium]